MCSHDKGWGRILTDTDNIEKVLSNLLSNALCYTASGGEVLVIPILREEYFGFTVKDSSIGIERDDLGKIFDEFYRTNEAKEVMVRIGTELGLNLEKEIME